MLMRTIFALALLCVTAQASAQTNVTATVTIEQAAPNCALSATSTTLNFATLTRPPTGTGIATVDASAETGFFSYVSGSAPLQYTGTPAQGKITLVATHANSYTTSITATPDSLARSGCTTGQCGIAFADEWAGGDTSTGDFTDISTTDTQTGLGGEGSSTTRYYRIGGTLSGLTRAVTVGTYAGTVTVSSTCN